MVGLGSQSVPQNPNEKSHNLVVKGKQVEVSSDEDGFKGAWYLATIVDTPPKSSSKKRKKAMVEYKNLLKEDLSPLVEPVDPEYIRPLPPVDSSSVSQRVFQENDVVDAGYRDGWWTGVVRKVLEGSRYRVYFDNPPDVIDFDVKDLRTHWDWVNGNWVSSEKQEVFCFLNQTTGSIFRSGTGVEVNIDQENVRDAWFPAVVIKENPDDTFLVKYQSSSNSDEAVTKVAVGPHHIRPIPPRYADRDYELLEKVDTQYGSGWRAGLITKVLPGRRYNVFFKQANDQKEFNHSEIRPNAEWVDGEWTCKSKEVLIASDNEKQLDSAHNSADQPEKSLKLGTCGAADGKTEQKAPSSSSTGTHCNASSHELPPSKKTKLSAPNSSGGHSRTPKKSAEESNLDAAVSATPLPINKMPVETPIEETLRGMSSPRTYGKRSRFKKPMDKDPAVAQTESPLGLKRTVDDKVLIRIKELPEAEKNKQQKTLALHRQKLETVTKKGISAKSPIPMSSSLLATPANANTPTKETGIRSKEADVVLALGARDSGLPVPGDKKVRVSSLPVPGDRKVRPMRNTKKFLNDLVGVKKPEGFKQQTPVGSSQRRKRGRPRRIVPPKVQETAKEGGGIKDVANGSAVKDQTINQAQLPVQKLVKCTGSQVASREGPTKVSEIDSRTKEVEMANPTVSSNGADDDQPLSTWIGGTHSSANAEDLRLSSARPEKKRRDPDCEPVPLVNEASRDATPDRNHCLPFAKRSLVWETIESMEVFRTTPQKPHFRPLADCKEEYREGSAIGVMVTFASLFDKITSLHIDDPKSMLESTLESLVDLERHGFDVSMPRDRVNLLLSIKDGKEELLRKSKDVESQIKEEYDERKKLDANINDIDMKIKELQEQLAAAKSTKENKDRDISSLHTRVVSMGEEINNARIRFEQEASAPWKLP